MRVGTYNIHHGAPAGAGVDHAGLAATCRDLDVDVLALQEVDRRVFRSFWVDQVQVVARATGLRPTWVSARSLGPFGRYGIALLTREPLGAVEFVRLPTFGFEQRMAIVGRIMIGGVAVSLAATHLQNRRRVAARQLEIVLDRLDRRGGPRLILGDLNMDADVVAPVFERRGFVWARSGPTFRASEPDRTIDWMAGTGVDFASVEVVDTLQSDHRPLLATISTAAETPV